jgi:hypothetical protein
MYSIEHKIIIDIDLQIFSMVANKHACQCHIVLQKGCILENNSWLKKSLCYSRSLSFHSVTTKSESTLRYIIISVIIYVTHS